MTLAINGLFLEKNCLVMTQSNKKAKITDLPLSEIPLPVGQLHDALLMHRNSRVMFVNSNLQRFDNYRQSTWLDGRALSVRNWWKPSKCPASAASGDFLPFLQSFSVGHNLKPRSQANLRVV